MINISKFKRYGTPLVQSMLAEAPKNPELMRKMWKALDGGPRMKPEEVVAAANKLHNSKLVSRRCPDFLTRYPRRVYLSHLGWQQVRDEILSTDDVRFLEVGSFLGNEVTYMQDLLRNKQPYSQGYAKGIELNPWHLVMGNLMRGDSPDDMDVYIGNACEIDDIEFANPHYIFSHGLLHSMNAKNPAGNKEKAIHLANVGRHLRAVNNILAPGGKVIGVAFSSRCYEPPRRESGPTPLSKDDLYQLSCDAGFENRAIYIEEKPLGHEKKGISYRLFFVLEDLPFYL